MTELGSEGLSAEDLANYPLTCRQAFLDASGKLRTASVGRRLHFILPEVDRILDDYLLWLSCFSE